MSYEARTDRIQDNVDASLDPVGFARELGGIVGPGEEMPRALVATIEHVRVTADELPHAGPESRSGGLDDSVYVRVHQAVRVQSPFELIGHARDTVDERNAILVVYDDSASSVAASDYVVDRSRSFHSRTAWHPAERAGRCSSPQVVRCGHRLARPRDVGPEGSG